MPGFQPSHLIVLLALVTILVTLCGLGYMIFRITGGDDLRKAIWLQTPGARVGFVAYAVIYTSIFFMAMLLIVLTMAEYVTQLPMT